MVAAEKAWWSPGTDIPVFDTALGRIGIEICYDNSFPEVARTLTLKGAEIIVNISAAVCGFEDHWTQHLYVRSTENVIWFLHVSVVGKQRNFECFGGSRLFNPNGEVVFEAARGEEAIAVTTRRPRRALHRPRPDGPVLQPKPRALRGDHRPVTAASEPPTGRRPHA